MSWKKPAAAVSAVGVLLISWFEGYAPTAEQPLPGDKWTVGFGHTGDVAPGDRVSLEQAFGILKSDAIRAERVVRDYVKVPLAQNQFDALTSLVFNIGTVAFVRSTLLECLNEGDYDGVAVQWMRWKYFKGKVVPGLERRRAMELAVFRGQPIEVVVGGRMCFGSAGCYSISDLLQGPLARPDGAEQGDRDPSEGSGARRGVSGGESTGGA